VSSSPHSAAGQAAGYQYQSEQALLQLIRSNQPGASLFIERLDDVEIKGDTALDIIQVKHHTGPGGSLSDTSADLWRTINVWISALEQLEPDDAPSFVLLTTSLAPNGSASALLRRNSARDIPEALRLLVETAGSDGADGTRTWRERFSRLQPDQQARLVGSITVADQQPQLVDIDDELRKIFAPIVRADHLGAFIERLKGWWFHQVADVLMRRLQAIGIEDLWFFLQELRDQFSLDNLPFEHQVPEPTDEETATYAASRFTQQLRIVDVSSELIGYAIRDYHRAYANTSKWSREGLLFPGELSQYEDELVDEWGRHFAHMRQEIGDEAAEAEMKKAGRELWTRLDREISLPRLRDKLDTPTIPRGTLHSLADGERVGWHPEYPVRLQQLLEEAAG
jgi:hypothetical protein